MSIKTEIPEGLLRDAIAVAIAESFTGEQRDALIRDVVRAHLQFRPSQYDKETLLSKAVGDMIRSIATEEIAKLTEQIRPRVAVMVEKALGASFVDTVLHSLESSLNSVVLQNLNIRIELSRSSER